MDLSYQYDEYVIGYVVADEDSGRTCNFQFDHADYSPVGKRHYVKFGCEGDDTHMAFTEKELTEMQEFIATQKDVKEAEKIITDAHKDDASHERFTEICCAAENGVFISDVAGW